MHSIKQDYESRLAHFFVSKITISTDKAPAALGAYSQAVRSGSLVFVSGQLAIDPETGTMSPEGIAEQTDQVIRNLNAIVGTAGATLADVVKTTVYLSNMNNFAAMNGVYEKYFSDSAPARATVEVSRLPKDALVEIDAIVVIPS
mgnify:FL=1